MKTFLGSFYDPFARFAGWRNDAKNCGSINRPDSAFLSTVDWSGVPRATIIPATSFDGHWVSFSLNPNSVSAKKLGDNPSAALTYYWDPLWRQVRLGGRIELQKSAGADTSVRITPDWFEFWQGRQYRLHYRLLYVRVGGGVWKISRLHP